MAKKEMEFLGGRMKQLREKNGVKSLESMRELLTASGNDEYRVDNKSTLSRAESGSAGEKLLLSGQGHTVMSLDTQGNRQNSSCAEIKSLFLIHLL